MKVILWAWMQAPGFNAFAAKFLRSLGYRVSTKVVGNNYFGVVSDSHNKAQIGFTGWTADYPAASDFFNSLFACASFLLGTRSTRMTRSSAIRASTGRSSAPRANRR